MFYSNSNSSKVLARELYSIIVAFMLRPYRQVDLVSLRDRALLVDIYDINNIFCKIFQGYVYILNNIEIIK